MKNIAIINGPNLNLLGRREPDIYGSQDFASYLESLKAKNPECDISYFQSNHEGAIIDRLHELADSQCDGIILNAGAYSHYSIAIVDAIASIDVPVVEVHISNIFAREEFRHHSVISGVCRGIISGFGLKSYELALMSLL